MPPLFNKFFGSDKKLFKKGKSQRNSDLVSAGRAILSSYGIGPIVENPMVYVENMKEYDEYMYEELKPMIEDTQAAEGQADITDLTYEELRARLPREITDDVVRLIATNPEAFKDFAAIETQEDVIDFNATYGVELVLPAQQV